VKLRTGEHEQDHAGKPRKLTRFLVAAGNPRSHHVQGDDQYHGFCAEAVQVAHELTERHVAENVQHVAVGDGRRRGIPEHQQRAGDGFKVNKIG